LRQCDWNMSLSNGMFYNEMTFFGKLFFNSWVKNSIIWWLSYIWFESEFLGDTITFIFAGSKSFRSFSKLIVGDTFYLGSKNYETKTHIDRAAWLWCLYKRTWLFSKPLKFECGIYEPPFPGNDISIKVQTNFF